LTNRSDKPTVHHRGKRTFKIKELNKNKPQKKTPQTKNKKKKKKKKKTNHPLSKRGKKNKKTGVTIIAKTHLNEGRWVLPGLHRGKECWGSEKGPQGLPGTRNSKENLLRKKTNTEKRSQIQDVAGAKAVPTKKVPLTKKKPVPTCGGRKKK